MLLYCRANTCLVSIEPQATHGLDICLLCLSLPSTCLLSQVLGCWLWPSFTEDECSSPFFIFGKDSCVELCELCVLSHSRWSGDRQHILNCSRLKPPAGIRGCVPVSSIPFLQRCISGACQSCPEPWLFATMDRLSAFFQVGLYYLCTHCA